MAEIGTGDLLLVVDLQNDFCPGGALAVNGGDEILPLINPLLSRFPHSGLTQDWHPPDHASFASANPGRAPFETIDAVYGRQILWPDHCVQGTRGAAFLDGLEVDRAEFILRKGFRRRMDSYSGFFENDRRTPTGLAGYLRERGIGRIFLAGLALDFCVYYTAVDGRRLGFEVAVLQDACRGIDVDGSLAAATEAMSGAGVHLLGTRDLPAYGGSGG